MKSLQIIFTQNLSVITSVSFGSVQASLVVEVFPFWISVHQAMASIPVDVVEAARRTTFSAAELTKAARQVSAFRVEGVTKEDTCFTF